MSVNLCAFIILLVKTIQFPKRRNSGLVVFPSSLSLRMSEMLMRRCACVNPHFMDVYFLWLHCAVGMPTSLSHDCVCVCVRGGGVAWRQEAWWELYLLHETHQAVTSQCEVKNKQNTQDFHSGDLCSCLLWKRVTSDSFNFWKKRKCDAVVTKGHCLHVVGFH